MREKTNFLLLGRILRQSKGFPLRFWGKSRVVHTWWGQQVRLKEEEIFGKLGNTGGIIQRDNSAGNCFVLRDLIPMGFFK